MTTMRPDNQALVRSPLANAGRIRIGQTGNVIITWLPRWVTSGLGIEDNLPITFNDSSAAHRPLRPIASLARDLAANPWPVQDFLVRLEGQNEEQLSVLIDGTIHQPEESEAAAEAHLILRDVTEIVRQRQRAAAVGAYHGLIGRSLRMLEVYRRISIYGPTEAPVVITGETGTGKELVARALHERSNRSNGPYVAVNCTALTPELFESELFGHEKGSFTGALREHRGRFERAHGGTLFLDEIGDMPLYTQAKLLRALEEGVIERVGGETPRPVDVRVVAATNAALEQSVAVGRFRADLFHRLSVFRIHLPPLRERTGDIPLLVEHFVEVFNRRYGRTVKRLTPEAMRMLEDYAWPGNIRELRNVIERLHVETTGEAIGARALASWVSEREYMSPGAWNADALYEPRSVSMPSASPFEWRVPPDSWSAHPVPRHRAGFPSASEAPTPDWPQHLPPLPLTIPEDEVVIESAPFVPSDITSQVLEEAFAREDGNITAAARSLGMHKATFYRHMKRLGLSREDLERTLGEGSE